MIKTASTVFALAAALCLTVAPAEARRKPKPEPEAAPAESKKPDAKKADAAGKPVQVATFGDWGTYLAKGRNKTCYALASPKERKPDVKHDAAYVFIADRPAEKVRNEVSIIMGFPMRDSAPAQAKVGTTSFELVAKGSNAWIKNPAEEAKFVDALKHAGRLVVKASPARGPATTDTYQLSGLKQALDRVGKECK